eukprot:GHRR01010394.1.p1 GENE.GHRR01010394.1~~GHRR01010394.1.p1  ORF type:complete len:172 (-),score=34.79 GHRR01010394.1:2608-3123(-)
MSILQQQAKSKASRACQDQWTVGTQCHHPHLSSSLNSYYSEDIRLSPAPTPAYTNKLLKGAAAWGSSNILAGRLRVPALCAAECTVAWGWLCNASYPGPSRTPCQQQMLLVVTLHKFMNRAIFVAGFTVLQTLSPALPSAASTRAYSLPCSMQSRPLSMYLHMHTTGHSFI